MKSTIPPGKWVPCLVLFLMYTLFAPGVMTHHALAEESGEESIYRHHWSLFIIGNTQGGDENGLSIGLEYEYRWHRYIGTGAMIEYAGGDYDAWVAGIPFIVHPHAGWYVLVAPGIEFTNDENRFQVRVGAGYDFEIAHGWSLAPEFNVDFSEGGERKRIYGVAVSKEY